MYKFSSFSMQLQNAYKSIELLSSIHYIQVIKKSFAHLPDAHLLPDTHQVIRKTCSEFAEKELLNSASFIDRNGAFPAKQVQMMGNLGLMATTLPEIYGGAGLDYLAYAVAVEEISRGCANAGVIMSAHNSLYLTPLQTWATDEQIEKFVIPFVDGNMQVQHLLQLG